MKRLVIAAIAALFACSVCAAEKPADKAADKAAASAGASAKQLKEDSDKQASAEREEAQKAQ